jgi:hypothetical protein
MRLYRILLRLASVLLVACTLSYTIHCSASCSRLVHVEFSVLLLVCVELQYCLSSKTPSENREKEFKKKRRGVKKSLVLCSLLILKVRSYFTHYGNKVSTRISVTQSLLHMSLELCMLLVLRCLSLFSCSPDLSSTLPRWARGRSNTG